jgi:hypothetical protein
VETAGGRGGGSFFLGPAPNTSPKSQQNPQGAPNSTKGGCRYYKGAPRKAVQRFYKGGLVGEPNREKNVPRRPLRPSRGYQARFLAPQQRSNNEKDHYQRAADAAQREQPDLFAGCQHSSQVRRCRLCSTTVVEVNVDADRPRGASSGGSLCWQNIFRKVGLRPYCLSRRWWRCRTVSY